MKLRARAVLPALGLFCAAGAVWVNSQGPNPLADVLTAEVMTGDI